MKKFVPLSIQAITAVLLLIITTTSCKKDSAAASTAATVSTVTLLTDVSTTAATASGIVATSGSSADTEVGLVYSTTNQTPTITDTKVANATVTDHFSITLTGLNPGTTYYVRAYATNATITGYGSTVSVTTQTTANATVATVTTFAGSGNAGFVNGTGTAACFYNPQGMVADPQGNIYVADQFNHVIRKVTPAGVVSTFCGNGTLGHTDGTATNASFYSPYALAIDAQNNIYVSDEGNNVIVKITPVGFATTIAGSGVAGYVNSTTGLTAQFNAPQGLAIDGSGNIYVADSQNNRIREISPSGVVTTFAGGSVGFTDDTGTAAAFRTPTALAFDTKGNLFVADYGNFAIREVTSAGVVSTVAGNRAIITIIGSPEAIAIDGNNNLFIADGTGRILRLINATNVLNSLAGTGGVYGFADGTNTAAQFNVPSGIVISGGALYVSDYNNNRIRKVAVTN